MCPATSKAMPPSVIRPSATRPRSTISPTPNAWDAAQATKTPTVMARLSGLMRAAKSACRSAGSLGSVRRRASPIRSDRLPVTGTDAADEAGGGIGRPSYQVRPRDA